MLLVNQRRSGLVALAAFALILLNSALLYTSIVHIEDSANTVRSRLEARQGLSEVLVALLDAETGQRGFLLTSDTRYLAPYYRAQSTIAAELTQLKARSLISGSLTERVAEIEKLAAEKLDEMAATISFHQEGGLQASRGLVNEDRGRQIMDRIRELLAQCVREEQDLFTKTTKVYEHDLRLLHVALTMLLVGGLMLVCGMYVLMRLEIRRRVQTARQLQEYAARVENAVDEAKRERNQIAKLNEASQFLQSCASTQEIGVIAGPLMTQFFASFDGALYAMASSRNQLLRIAAWGGAPLPEVVLPSQCWGLRRGQPHVHDHQDCLPACEHFDGQEANGTWCIPLAANGSVLGLLAMRISKGNDDAVGQILQEARTLATLVARQLALSLSNLRLQETLQDQSIRDPLTGLFNRRYLEIVAEKEFALAHRHDRTMAVIMLDVDHFKRFNDLHGHAAGDAALAAVANYIGQSMRDGDWAFRYGGEEFVILLRETDLEAATAKASQLREGISNMPLVLGSTPLPSVTASLGVAAFPGHGRDLDELVRCADAALYASKHSGRNKVTCAELLAA